MLTAPSKRILYTRADGGVGVVAMTAWCHRALTLGGGWLTYSGTTAAREAAKAEARGCDPRIEHRFATALEHGGCTDAEAWGLIRDRDLPGDAGAADLVDPAELPADRWFRNAWRRSANGGPIWIDLDRARPVQRWRIAAALSEENARRARRLEDPLEIDFAALRRATEAAPDEGELRAVWPSQLPVS